MNTQIIEEAAEWLIEFGSGDAGAETKRAFDAWLRISPEHVRIYLELLPLWEDGKYPLPGEAGDEQALISRARAQSTIVSLEHLSSPEPVAATRGSGRRWGVAASIGAGIVVTGCILWLQNPRPPSAAAFSGARGASTFEQGSSVTRKLSPTNPARYGTL